MASRILKPKAVMAGLSFFSHSRRKKILCQINALTSALTEIKKVYPPRPSKPSRQRANAYECGAPQLPSLFFSLILWNSHLQADLFEPLFENSGAC